MVVKPNQIVELKVYSTGGEQLFRTRVEDAHKGYLLLGAPIHHNEVVPIRVGTKVEISYIVQDVKNEGRFRADGVVERRESGVLPTLLVALKSPWERTQDRNFVRVDVFIETNFVFMSDQKKRIPCTIRNLSGGGCFFTMENPLPDEEKRLKIRIPLDEMLVLEGVIVRRLVLKNAYGYGISFSELDERARRLIIQYVFRRQLEDRRNGS